MSVNTITINTAKDRFSFVLHTAANMSLLAGIICLDKSFLNAGFGVAVAAIPHLIPVLSRHNIGAGLLGHKPLKPFAGLTGNKKDQSLFPMSNLKSMLHGDVNRLQHASDRIAKRLGIDPVKVRVIGRPDDDTPKNRRGQKKKFNNLAEFAEAAREDAKASALDAFKGKRGVLNYNVATGKAVIGLSRELVGDLTQAELEAVIGHELGHYAGKHMPLARLANFAGNAAMAIAWLHVGQIVCHTGVEGLKSGFDFLFNASTARKLVQSHYSRVREFQADRIGALATSPKDLVSALIKITGKPEGEENKTSLAERISTFEHSHPPLAQRIKRLDKLMVSSSPRTDVGKTVRWTRGRIRLEKLGLAAAFLVGSASLSTIHPGHAPTPVEALLANIDKAGNKDAPLRLEDNHSESRATPPETKPKIILKLSVPPADAISHARAESPHRHARVEKKLKISVRKYTLKP